MLLFHWSEPFNPSSLIGQTDEPFRVQNWNCNLLIGSWTFQSKSYFLINQDTMLTQDRQFYWQSLIHQVGPLATFWVKIWPLYWNPLSLLWITNDKSLCSRLWSLQELNIWYSKRDLGWYIYSNGCEVALNCTFYILLIETRQIHLYNTFISRVRIWGCEVKDVASSSVLTNNTENTKRRNYIKR